MFYDDPERYALLIDRRIVPITGEITTENAALVIESLTTLQLIGTEPINMMFCSDGGHTEAGFAIADFVSHCVTTQVHGRAFGAVGSAATFIFAACDVRICTPNTQFLVHMSETHAGLKHGRRADRQLLENEMSEIDEMMFRHYKRHLGWKKKQTKALCDRGEQPFHQLMSAEKALQTGLATKVLKKRKASLGLF